MSTAKTLSLSISLLVTCFWLPACAPQKNTSSLQPPECTVAAAFAEAAAEPLPAVAEPDTDLFPVQMAEEESTLPESDETVAREVRELDALGNWEEGPFGLVETSGLFDFPVTLNKQVQFYLDFFQNEQRQTFSRWLARSGRYLAMIENNLQEAGLPRDLVYLPMIESGFSLTAFSRAQAVGPWQFMRGTALQYGLRIDDHVDERRDPYKSTAAAIKYLSRLYAEFGDWYLAVAGYNAGEGKIRWAVRQAEAADFWQASRFLHTETKRYVPKLIAAILIAREPARYGFTDIIYDEPLAHETLEVPRLTSLKAVAVAGAIDFEELRDLNRELRQAVTPPKQASYPLRVPSNKAALIAENLPRVRPVVTTGYKTHVVGRRETIAQVCRKYDLNRATLLKANSLRSAALAPGQQLRIPYQDIDYQLFSDSRLAGLKPAAAAAENLVLHSVKPGETVSGIARSYNVPAHLIIAWNDLRDAHRITAGQQLALYLAPAEKPAAPEEAVLSPRTFKLAADSTAMRAKVPAGKKPARSPRPTYYVVKGGDTLWEISRRFKVSPEQIKRWNRLQDDVIQPGRRLLLRLDEDRNA